MHRATLCVIFVLYNCGQVPGQATKPNHVNGGRGQTTRATGHAVVNSHGNQTGNHGHDPNSFGNSGGGSSSGGNSGGGSSSGGISGTGSNSGSHPGATANTTAKAAGSKTTRSPDSGTNTPTPAVGSGSNHETNHNHAGTNNASKGNNGASGMVGVSFYTMVFQLALIHTLCVRN